MQDVPATMTSALFQMTDAAIDIEALQSGLGDPSVGGIVCFEGRVRNHNAGRAVRGLHYQAYASMAERQGHEICIEALERFDVAQVFCVHRHGELLVGDVAVWVYAAAAHRAAAFEACRYIIDEVKSRVPIWKKEHYVDGPSEWVACHGCATEQGAEDLLAKS